MNTILLHLLKEELQVNRAHADAVIKEMVGKKTGLDLAIKGLEAIIEDVETEDKS